MTVISSFMPAAPAPPEKGTGKKRRRAGCWSSPALSDGLLFLRREDILLAYDLRDKSGT